MSLEVDGHGYYGPGKAGSYVTLSSRGRQGEGEGDNDILQIGFGKRSFHAFELYVDLVFSTQSSIIFAPCVVKIADYARLSAVHCNSLNNDSREGLEWRNRAYDADIDPVDTNC